MLMHIFLSLDTAVAQGRRWMNERQTDLMTSWAWVICCCLAVAGTDFQACLSTWSGWQLDVSVGRGGGEDWECVMQSYFTLI